MKKLLFILFLIPSLTYCQKFGVMEGIIASSGSISYDPDAVKFFAKVANNGGTLTLTEKSAVSRLCKDLKDSSLWTLRYGIYPYVGTDSNSMKTNLADTSKNSNLVNPNGAMTFTSLGFHSGGGGFNTKIVPSTTFAGVNNWSAAFSSSIDAAASSFNYDIGAQQGGGPFILISARRSSDGSMLMDGGGYFRESSTGNSTANGIYVGSSTAASTAGTILYKNGTDMGSSIASGVDGTNSLPTIPLYIGCNNSSGTVSGATIRTYGFAWIGQGLTSTQARQLTNIIQRFNTTLGR